MKNFRLLLKNSIKSLWNSRALVTQFTALTTIATIVVSSISLGNFSLRNSISEIEDKSNLNGFSVRNEADNNFAYYNIINSSNNLVKSLDTLTIQEAVTPTKIYNPLNTPTQLTVNNVPYETYGFFEKYFNDNYTTSDVSLNQWKNMVFGNKQQDALSIIVEMTDPKYMNRLSDIFTLYNKILPPSPTRVEKTKYEVFFDPNIYSFNPWTLVFDPNSDQMFVNKFGMGTLQNFENEYNNIILYNHGVFDDKFSYVIDTEFSYLNSNEMAQYKDEIDLINKEVKLMNKKQGGPFTNNWKQKGSTNILTSHDDFMNLIQRELTIFNTNYWQFLNKLRNKITNSFMVDSKKFILDYSLDIEKSKGLSKFFSEIYQDTENPFHEQINTIFQPEEDKYFKGKIEIPLIPFITVSPNIQNVNDWTLDQYKQWALNGFLDETKSIVNINGIKNIIDETFTQLSNQVNKVFEQKLNSVDVEIRNEYYNQYDLEYFLKSEMGLNFSKSSNFTITDSTQNTYILANNKYYGKTKVNDLVINDGRGLIKNKINSDYVFIEKSISRIFSDWIRVIEKFPIDYRKNFFLNSNQFWSVMQILSQLQLNTNEEIKKDYFRLVNTIMDIDLMSKNYQKWERHVYSFIVDYYCSLFAWNGAGYNVEFTKNNNLGIEIDFNGVYYEPSSFTTVTSLNYAKIKNGSKQIVNSTFVEKAMNLPFKNKEITQQDIIDNYGKYKDNFIYNPYTRKLTFYNDFLDWLNRLDSRFKISVNGDEFVIIGTGINTEFLYPITSNNQLLINNNAPVLYTNELGYGKIARNNTVNQQSNYFVNYYSKLDPVGNSNDVWKVNKWTQRVNDQKLAYDTHDSSQPNNLLYLRMNFPYTILKTVLNITLIIAAIVVLLSFTFIYILMKSIVNQNLNTFAIGMANGISKRKLLFSFIPFVLIPSFISAFLGYGFSFLLYPTISNAIQNYWILNYVKFAFNPGYLVLAFLILALIIFAVQTIVIYIMLSKNVSTLLNTKMEFKYNKLVQHSRKLVKGMSPLASFRITYMLGNIGRFILLLLMMTSFVSLTTISASTPNTFNNAVQKTMDNKQYNYAIDLVTPTIQGGYYYDIPYKLLGTRQKGLVSLYDVNKTEGFYNKGYKEALTYNIPNSNDSLTYSNLFLPQAGLIADVQNNITFFRNNIIHLLSMDFGIDFFGNYINPWQWAKKILPTSLTILVENKLQEQLNYAFLYVCWLQKQPDINTNEKTMWLYDLSSPVSFVDSFNKSKNPEKWDQTNWLIQLVKKNNKYVWVPNQQYLSDGLPNFTLTKPLTYLMTRILSSPNNPYYQKFINELQRKQRRNIGDPNFMIALNIIPTIPELDETYTYIDATSNFNKKNKNFNLKIYGIKPESTQVTLWNEYYGKDLKPLFNEFEIVDNTYPLIINEVVYKKYGLRVNQEIEIVAHNKYDRYTNKFLNKQEVETHKFKIIGVTTSKSEEQFYTTQEIANKILGFTKPELATKYDLENGNYDYKWINQQEIDEYVPFNGVFSKQELPKMLANFATLYSTSGMSPIGGTLPTAGYGDGYIQIVRNYSNINKILKFNIIDETQQDSYENIMAFRKEYERVFGNDKYYNSAMAGIDVTFASALLGSVIDDTVANVNFVCTISLLPAILIIIILMSYMMVVESRKLVALLKVLGFSNWSNTITLSTVQFVVVGLSILLGYGIGFAILSMMKAFAFNFLSIIINPVIPLWTIGATLGVLALIVTTITLTIFLNLRKTNPAQEIAIR